MVIGILKEPEFENRVAVLPEIVKSFKGLDVAGIFVEKGAGSRSFIDDQSYMDAGAEIKSRNDILNAADLIISIHPPKEELDNIGKDKVLISVFNALDDKEIVVKLKESGLTTFSMELVPRTTRAQSMDILSSMATVAGYKAVLMAANYLPKFFPMFMTAAGSIVPAKVLVLGAGVAGLQAISTARRLGAVVQAFDVRSAVKEEVESLGAKFVEVEGAKEDADAGGYAVEQTEEFKKLQLKAIYDESIKSDVIISTAQIPGRKAPELIPEATVNDMKKGSVIVDLAASTGGNCPLTQNGEIIDYNGITIIGRSDLPSSMPMDASKMFGKNILNFTKLMIKDGNLDLNFEDDIVEGTCLTYQNEIKNKRVKSLFE
jgi:proton-translocating NAD(P)+ transhydrogenase subunit alpha